MKRDEIPQDHSALLQGERKAVYAVDASGRYVRAATSGWSAEDAVTRLAVEEFQRQAEAARHRVLAGESAPLEYHMYRQRMDVATLAQAAGLFRWRVRRHLRPRVFARLAPRLRTRYAEALGLAPETLSRVPEQDPGRESDLE